MPGEVVTIARFHDLVAAQMALNRLQEAGIPATISDTNSSALFGSAFASIQLQVAESHAEPAVALLEAADPPLPDEPDDAEAITRRDDFEASPKPKPPELGIQPTVRAPASSAETALTAQPPTPAAPPDEDDDMPDFVLRYGPNEMAQRAWRAAAIGLVFMPAQFYSWTLLAKLLLVDEELSPPAVRNVFWALVLNTLGLGLCCFWGLSLRLAH